MEIDFTKKLMMWNRDLNRREMPWKGEADPYRIWLSEIILQQTRVEQGTEYYKKFISGFPTIQELAAAPEQRVFKYWEGLGYYTRCRNLLLTAKKIAGENNGAFPSAYEEILALPGIGPYTASAIASFAFGLPHAVVDGNVERVLSRYFGISTPIGSAAAKKLYTTIATRLLDKKSPGAYNQAIMDFGATVCKPQNPLCASCIQADNCQAFQRGWTKILPVKITPPPKQKRYFYYFIVHSADGTVWIRERKAKDIWQNLNEFVLWETGKIIPQNTIHLGKYFKETFADSGARIMHISEPFNQTLTHQRITGQFVHIRTNDWLPVLPEGYHPISLADLAGYPFPKMIADYIRIFPSI